MHFCQHCKSEHAHASDIAACGKKKREAAERRIKNADLPPTEKQLAFIAALTKKKGMEGEVVTPPTRANASHVIAYLKKQPDREEMGRLRGSYVIVNLIESGRYAVTVGLAEAQKYVFFRVSRPTRGDDTGCLKVQTQHSDDMTLRLLFSSDGALRKANSRPIYGTPLSELLTLVAVDQKKAALDYGREVGQCARCGRELTDERSRYYSIGPECEKQWPSMVEYVNELHGQFRGVDTNG